MKAYKGKKIPHIEINRSYCCNNCMCDSDCENCLYAQRNIELFNEAKEKGLIV